MENTIKTIGNTKYMLDSKLEGTGIGQAKTSYWISVDYDEFKPDTYRGITLTETIWTDNESNSKEIMRINTGNFNVDYATMEKIVELSYGRKEVICSSSLDNFAMDSKPEADYLFLVDVVTAKDKYKGLRLLQQEFDDVDYVVDSIRYAKAMGNEIMRIDGKSLMVDLLALRDKMLDVVSGHTVVCLESVYEHSDVEPEMLRKIVRDIEYVTPRKKQWIAIAEPYKQWRESVGFTKAETARAMGIAASTLDNWERGGASRVSKQIEAAYGLLREMIENYCAFELQAELIKEFLENRGLFNEYNQFIDAS